MSSSLNSLLFRNRYCRHGKKAIKKSVNLEYYNSALNLGDALSPIIYEWMLNRKGLDKNLRTKKTLHLMAVGSILGGNGYFDSIVWGSGIKSFDQIANLGKRKYFQKLDIRAVRGPLTRQALIGCGYKCPEIFGDPAVLMPFIYKPNVSCVNNVSLVLHFKHDIDVPHNINKINICTDDYKTFIDLLCSSKRIISSSLHGIILAEAYGIPAIFLGNDRDGEIFKYYDWYFSTGRKNIKIAYSIEEALEIVPMELPDLSKMQQDILNAFPYDLWEN